MKRKNLLAYCAPLFFLVACGGKASKATETVQGITTNNTPSVTNSPSVEAVDTGPQLAKGLSVWSDSCSMCHGDQAEGNGKALAMVGEGSLGRFPNALELHNYIKEKMPKTDPGSLSPEESTSVTAWILQQRGVTLESPLDTTNAMNQPIN